MEPIPAEGLNERSRNDRANRVSNLTVPVLLHDATHGAINGHTRDEAFGGLGVLLERQPDIRPGQETDVFHNGMRMTAIVRHVRPDGENFRVGLAWKSASLSQRAKDALRNRNERGMESDDPCYERFMRSIPGIVYSMWSMYESKQWTELALSAERLAKQAQIAEVDDLAPYINRFTRFITDGEEFETIGKVLHDLIETAIGVCESRDW